MPEHHSASAPRRARPAPEPEGAIEDLIHSQLPEVLCGISASPRLTEDLALALLSRRDLPHQAIEQLARNGALMRHRKVMLAVVSHPRTPRHVSLPVARHLYTFELMQLALLPSVPGDLKVAMEETLIARLESISEGERLSLARRGSTRIAAALLSDAQPRIIHAALANPALTETWIVKAVLRDDAPEALVHSLCSDAKWSLRRDIQIALLRNQHTPLAKAVVLAEALPTQLVRDVLSHSRLNASIRDYLLKTLTRRERVAENRRGQLPAF